MQSFNKPREEYLTKCCTQSRKCQLSTFSPFNAYLSKNFNFSVTSTLPSITILTLSQTSPGFYVSAV